MSSLTGQIIYQFYGDLLTTTNSGQGLSATLEPVQDGLGQSSPMQIALDAINFTRTLGNTFQLDAINLTASATDINAVAKSDPVLPGTGGVVLPSGTTAQRLAPPVNGTLRYNSQLNALEAYQNGIWGNLQAGAVVGPGVSITGDIAIFGDTSGLLLSDSGVQISNVPAPLLSLGHGSSLVTDVQISGVDILNFGSSLSNDVGVIFRQTDYVLGIFPNTIVSKFPNIVLGFANPSSTDSALELTEGAMLLSRLTQTEINALVPIDGMLVYNSTTDAFNFYQNGVWVDLATGAVLSVAGTANEIVATGTSSVVLSIANNPTLPGTADVLIPAGTTAQRPGSPTNGMIRYNSTLGAFEGYQSGAWTSFGSGGGSVTSITAGTNLTGGTITTTGTIALSATPTGLTSLGVGNLSLSANQIISANVNGNISLLPDGTGLVQLGAFPVTVNSTGTVAGNVVDFPTGIIDILTSQEVNIVAVGGNPGPLRLYDANNSNFVAIFAPSIVPSDYGWTWPATDGTNGQALTTNGVGVLSWSSTGNNTATYILQTPDATLPNSQALSDLGSAGLLKINVSGVVQLAIADVDYGTVTTVAAYASAAAASAAAAASSATSANGSASAANTSALAAAAAAIAAAVAAGTITGATSAKFIIQESNSNLPNAQVLGVLSTGLVKNTTTGSTGVLSIASAGTDYYAPGFPTTIRDSGSATFNLFVGTDAGNESLSGSFNAGFGDACLFGLNAGNNNAALGYNSLHSTSTGSDLVAVGYNAGSAGSAWTQCVFLGSGATGSPDVLSNSVALGANVTVDLSNSIVLGNGANVGIGATAPSYPLHIKNVNDISAISIENTTDPLSTNASGIVLYPTGGNLFLINGDGSIINLSDTVTETAISYTVLVTDHFIGVTDTSAARTITLPTAASANKGRIYTVKDQTGGANTNNITVNVTGGGNIDGAATSVINTNYGSLSFYSNGTQWYIW